jgi:hypothetical protein
MIDENSPHLPMKKYVTDKGKVGKEEGRKPGKVAWVK